MRQCTWRVLTMCEIKVEEADYITPLEKIFTCQLKLTQRCADCGNIRQKELWEREHNCSCGAKKPGCQCTLVILRYGLGRLKILDQTDEAKDKARGPGRCV